MARAYLRDFASRYTAAWCSHDPARVASFFSETGSISANGGPPAVGRVAITEFAEGFMRTFPDLRVVFDELVVEDEYVVYHWTLTGTDTAPDGSRHRVQLSGFEKWTLGAENLIAQSLGHFDEDSYQFQLRHGCDT